MLMGRITTAEINRRIGQKLLSLRNVTSQTSETHSIVSMEMVSSEKVSSEIDFRSLQPWLTDSLRFRMHYVSPTRNDLLRVIRPCRGERIEVSELTTRL